MLPTISLHPIHYRGQESIALSSKLPKDLELEVRKIKTIKWCGEKNCWYLPLTKENYLRIKASLKDKVVFNIEPLKKYLEQKKAVQPASKKQAISKTKAQLSIHFLLSEANVQAFLQYQNLLKLKGYSERTIETYSNSFHFLLRLLGDVPVFSLNKKQVHSYLLWLIKDKGYTQSSIHTMVNAIKFYFEKVEGKGAEFYDLPRPKKAQKLPDILAEEEVVDLIKKIERTFYWRTFQRNKQKAIRDGNWKYLQDEKGEYLFNLISDPGEKNDLKTKGKIIFTRLKKKYAEWEKTVLQPIPL